MSFGEKILDYKEDIITDLSELIAIKSVTGIQDGCKEALDWMMKKAISFGLKAESIENTAGHAELGEGGKLCGVLAHLDVVPEGNNWDSLPFELSIGDNGYMYGRGVTDDKGAALVNLYCLKALKDNGVVGKNTLRAIFLPNLFSAFGTFLMRQFFMSIPQELEDAARIDGCGHGRIFLQIMLPLVKPGLVSLGVLTLRFAWNSLMWPMIVNTSPDKMTLAAGLSYLQGQYLTDYPSIMAGALLSIIPLIIIYAIFQKQFIEGIALTGIKG